MGSVTRGAVGVPESSNMSGMMYVMSIPIIMAIGGAHCRPRDSLQKKTLTASDSDHRKKTSLYNNTILAGPEHCVE